MTAGRSRKKDARPRSRKRRGPAPAVKFLCVIIAALSSSAFFLYSKYNKADYITETEHAGSPAERTASGAETEGAETVLRRPAGEILRPAEEINEETPEIKAEEEPEAGKENELPEQAEAGYIRIEQKEKDKISLCFAGDILFDPNYAIMASMLQRSSGAPDISTAFDQKMLSFMHEADIFMLNNEFPYSKRGSPLENKQFTFRADPSYASLIKDMGADIVALANNHLNDYGALAMQDTFDILKANGIPYAGAGRNIEEASAPVYFTNGEVKIAIICATQIERTASPDTAGASENSAGVFRCFENIDKLLTIIRKTEEEGCFTIVYIHWGTEGTEKIDDWQLKQGKEIAGAGADLIVGDHPHVLQRIDWIGSTPVIYSLGNYLFNSKTQDTCLYSVTLNAHEPSIKELKFIPAVQSGCRTRCAEPDEAARIIANMRRISPDAVINEDGTIELRKNLSD